MTGVIENDEWDAFATGSGSKTYLQWAPGVIYVAGSAPLGSDLLLSLDLGNDGWLVGSDNYEARLRVDASNNPSLSVRRLNALNVAGPTWEDLPGWVVSSVCKTSISGGNIEYELQLSDAGIGVLPQSPQTIGARVDMISSNEPAISNTQTRLLAPIHLARSRSEGLPANLHFEIDRADKPAVPGESASIRFNFSYPTKPPAGPAPVVKKINISAEGSTKGKMSDMTSPLPPFDKSGRTWIDYVSKVAIDANPGYHILQSTLTLGDDTPASVERSFEIAEPIDIKIEKPLIAASPTDRTIVVNFEVLSNLLQPTLGSVVFTMDPTFHVLNQPSTTVRFTMEPKGRKVSKFELYVPANITGTYPVTFDITAGTMKRRIVRYLTFGSAAGKPKKHHGLFN
jgi:hypothetical protein